MFFIFLLESGKGLLNLGCGPKNLSLDDYSYGETLSNQHMLSATALQFSSTGNSRFYKCNTDRCNEESPTKYYKTTIEGFFLIIVGIFGALGNILTMIVLTRPSMRSNVNLIFVGKSHSTNLVSTFDHTRGFTSSFLIVASKRNFIYLQNTRDKFKQILQAKLRKKRCSDLGLGAAPS